MIILMLAVLGLCFGSFVNALVWRLHEQRQPQAKRVASLKELSISKGRSMCPHCQHTLQAIDLLPVVSWLWLRGRCRYCKAPIGWQYPLVELVVAILYVGSYIFWPYTLNALGAAAFGCWLVACVRLVALLVYDVRWMLLPNVLVFPLIAVTGLQALLLQVSKGLTVASLVGVLGAVLIGGGLFYILFQVSDGRWIGGGDVKLGWAIGLLVMTPLMACLVLFMASLLGLLVSLPGVVLKKVNLASRIPFGPYLIAATILVFLFGQPIVDWYQLHLLLMP